MMALARAPVMSVISPTFLPRAGNSRGPHTLSDQVLYVSRLGNARATHLSFSLEEGFRSGFAQPVTPDLVAPFRYGESFVL